MKIWGVSKRGAAARVCILLVGVACVRILAHVIADYTWHRPQSPVATTSERHASPPLSAFAPDARDAFGERRIVAVLSFDALLAEYRENEFAAAAKYENAFVEVTGGTIRDVGRDNNGIAYIVIGPADMKEVADSESDLLDFARRTFTARVDRVDEADLQTLRRGQRVAVRCRVSYPQEKVFLTACGVAP